jgi:glycosyltransferase involved in cell wall biosynthesis
MLGPPSGSSGPVPHIETLLAEALRARGVDVRTEPWGRTSGSGAHNLAGRLRQAWRIRSAPAVRTADVILVQTSLEPRSVATDLVLAALVGRGRRRLVLQFHGGDAHRLGRPGARIFTLAVRALLRLSAATCVLSSEERDAIRAQPGGPRCEVVANPFVAAVVPAQVPRDASDGTLRALFVGRLLEEKGVLVAVDAIARLRPDARLQLTVAGDGPAAAAARKRVEELGVGDRVEFVGRLDRAEVADAYANADVFVLPTYWEGFPTVLSEAMAAGLPIVTTPTRGIKDHLVDGVNALFVPQRDAGAVARALEQLIDEPELGRRMSEANRRQVLEFAPDRVVGAYLALLRDVAEK